MEIIVFFIIIIAIVAKQLKKSGSESKSGQSSSASSASYRYASQSSSGNFTRSAASSTYPRQAPRMQSVGSANVARDGRVYASIDFDNTHYHAEGFDFDCCISFKGLPAGTDELAVLIASNNRHERELSKLLQVRDN